MAVYLGEEDPRERTGYYLRREDGRLIEAPPPPKWWEVVIGSIIGGSWIAYAVGGSLGWW